MNNPQFSFLSQGDLSFVVPNQSDNILDYDDEIRPNHEGHDDVLMEFSAIIDDQAAPSCFSPHQPRLNKIGSLALGSNDLILDTI